MSCNHCSTKFNFFHKELGCSNCGLSFCNKCLKQKSKIPNKGVGEHNVCRACFLILSAGSSSSNDNIIYPPEAYLKRLEALENPVAPPITIYKSDPKLLNLRAGLSQADLKLLERLEKLKNEGKPPAPSESEIRRRLANLKGENNYVEQPIKMVMKDGRTDQEKVDTLLDQFMTERDIELAYNPQEEIEVRLATLREQGVRPNEGPFVKNLHDSSSNSEEEIDKITKKIMDEVALDDNSPIQVRGAESMEENTEDELPWCVLCNNDAMYRCPDCGNDLYCGECNQTVHNDWGNNDHKVILFKRK